MTKKKSAARLEREIAEALSKKKAPSGKHKGDRYVGMQGLAYRQGWDDAGAGILPTWRAALGDETLKVTIDALLEGDVERGFKLIHLTGTFEAALENRAFKDSGWSSQEQLDVRRDPKLTEDLVSQFKRTAGCRKWQAGYVDRVLDTLEKKVGLREA